ncbi:efflux RND transporter permease subunit [Paraconexibacter algicola]|uniref:SSD domain-containing protein n=1 Tax=Paraconexibacter algicola TaxID=2133960 RepID=A0A2T4UFJ9_9ACTN|nr:MMPL family transporter [Paraconexibacter algicola]PTL56566.1 hypothetical protein C7Y72_16590 [Paraconexibacter algicola]
MVVRGLTALMRGAARRPLAASVLVAVLVAAGTVLALQLRPTAATETLVGKSSDSYEATQRFYERFGDDAVFVLVREDLKYLALTADLQRVLGLEGCLSGNRPAGVVPRGGENGPCARLARTKPTKVVFGPGTFLNTAVTQIAEEFGREQQRAAERGASAAEAARRLARSQGKSTAEARRLGEQARELVNAEFTRNLLLLATKYGVTSLPQLNNPDFVSNIIFDDSRPVGCPKARFAYILPSCTTALITVRLNPGLSEGDKQRAIADIRAAVAMPDWRLENGKGTYVVTGAPVVVADLTDAITDSIIWLIVGALAVMALTLALVFRARLRLLPLVVALAATAVTFGVLSLVGASLTMASIAVLPILIGLAVDYAIQLHARLEEERRAAAGDLDRAIDRVAAAGAPTVVTAAVATAAGFLVLVLSPVPMVRGFGILLVLGIALALLAALVLGTAVLAGTDGRRLPDGGPLGAALRGAGELVVDNPVGRGVRRGGGALRARAARIGRRGLALATARPGRVVAVALAVAVAGWAIDTGAEVESDIQKLVPRDLPAITDLQALQESTGVGGEIDVVITSDRLTDPAVVRWMTSYQDTLLKRFGYSAKRGCGKAELCPAFSLPDLFRSGTANRSRAQIEALLDAVPPYFSQGVITADKRTASLAFGIRLMSLERQQEVIDLMRDTLDPPAGVRAELAGLPVLAAEANAAVASPWRRAGTLIAGLVAVALVLLVAFRDRRRALVPLVPIAFATGWSALILFLTRIPLNPMSVTLGALVIAISTEFSVLLSERYRQERLAGHPPEEALRRTYASTGAAVRASGITAIAGFAVLVLSDIRMLRDFGAVTVIDLTVSLLGVLLVLPAVLLLAERGELVPARLRRGTRAGAGSTGRPRIPLPRRKQQVATATPGEGT